MLNRMVLFNYWMTKSCLTRNDLLLGPAPSAEEEDAFRRQLQKRVRR